MDLIFNNQYLSFGKNAPKLVKGCVKKIQLKVKLLNNCGCYNGFVLSSSRKDNCMKIRQMIKPLMFSFILIILSACSTTGPLKRVLDQSSNKKPSWTDSSKLSWKEKNYIFFKSTHTIRADERANGCLDLVKLDAKENLISEVKMR